MITLIAVAQIADLLNGSRDKYSAKAESEFYESLGSSRAVRVADGGRTYRFSLRPEAR